MTDSTIKIRIGDREYDKPYDPACAVCASPVLLQVDTMLSHGWTYARVQEYIRSMRPAGVRQVPIGTLRSHIIHLAAPHLQARRQLEEAATARGASITDGSPPVSPADLAQLTLQKAYETLQDGGSEASVRDAVAILRMQRDIEHDEAGRELAGTVEQWQAAVRELLWIARKHLGVHWADFAADVRGSDTLKAIMPPAREETGDVTASGN